MLKYPIGIQATISYRDTSYNILQGYILEYPTGYILQYPTGINTTISYRDKYYSILQG